MGPFANPVVARSRPRGLAVLVLAAAPAVAMIVVAPGPSVSEGRPRSSTRALVADDLARIARAHEAWMADHGRGCARATDHLVAYAPGTSSIDRWGNPIALTCARERGADSVTVRITSRGADGIADTPDDLWASWSEHGASDHGAGVAAPPGSPPVHVRL